MLLKTLVYSITREVEPEDAPVGETLAFMALGGATGGMAYVAMGLALESLLTNTKNVVSLSYGQQAGILSLPTCVFLGMGIGFALYFARMRQLALSAGLLCVTGLLAGRFTWWLWCDQRRNYGYDRSEVVLYYPPMMLCGVTVLLAMILLLCSALLISDDWRERRTGRKEP